MALKIALAGASGFIGKKLSESLLKEGYEVWPLVRTKTNKPKEIFYDYELQEIELLKLAQCQAVINLSGKNILGLWTPNFKQELYDSRVKTTELIAESLARLKHGPNILLNASAVGIYGDQAEKKLDEESSLGHDFLARLAIDWEKSTEIAKEAHIRVVNMRFGIVLDPTGGSLETQIKYFKHGLGATLGSGEQYFSYVTRDELILQILFLLKNPDIFGPVNCVSLNPITNKEFSQKLSQIFGHKLRLKVPGIFIKALGEQGKMLLSSERVYPKVLLAHKFGFSH